MNVQRHAAMDQHKNIENGKFAIFYNKMHCIAHKYDV